MQTLRGFRFERVAEPIALDVMSELRIEKRDGSEKRRDDRDKNQRASSTGGTHSHH